MYIRPFSPLHQKRPRLFSVVGLSILLLVGILGGSVVPATTWAASGCSLTFSLLASGSLTANGTTLSWTSSNLSLTTDSITLTPATGATVTMNAPGSVSVPSPLVDTQYTLTLSSPRCTSKTYTATVVATPDVRGDSAPTPNGASVNINQTFTTTVTNIGPGTASSFPTVMEILSSTGTHVAYVAASPSTQSLSSGTAGTVTGQYTFTSTGSYRVQFCGNMDTTGTNIITETVGAYGNNCSAYQTVNVTAPDYYAGDVSATPPAVVANTAVQLSALVSSDAAGMAYAGPTHSFLATARTPSAPRLDLKDFVGTLAARVVFEEKRALAVFLDATNILGVKKAFACADFNTASLSASGNTLSWTYYNASIISLTITPTVGAVALHAGSSSGNTTVSAPAVDTQYTLDMYYNKACQGPSHTYYYATIYAGAQPFTDLFEIDNDTNHAIFTDIYAKVATTSPAITPGGSNTAFVNYSFQAPGTWYVRACADTDSTNSGSITESDESNNCGNWVPITVTAPPGASVSCSPSPTTVNAGDTVTWTPTTYNFTSPNPVTYTWTDAYGTPLSPLVAAQYLNKYTQAQGGFSYAVNVSATNGVDSAGPSSCVSVAVNGIPNTCSSPVSAGITASPTRVVSGGSSTISWTAGGVTPPGATCTIAGKDGSGNDITGFPISSPSDASCNIPSGGANQAIVTNITSQSTFTITCAGAASQSVIVNVSPNFRAF